MKRIMLAKVPLLICLGLMTGVAFAQSKSALAKATAPEAQQAAASAVEVTDEITPPRLREVATPEYTPEAKKLKIEGQVTLQIVINKKGEVVDAKVVKGIGHGLDENAVAAVKEWRYSPAEKDGEPIAVKLEVTVDFYLGM
ncbi:MAG: energy transducer TonB [Acidobacteriota bacterium]|nr:energy transducer TonB [Acidobacteriota bacterium]